MRHLHRAQAIGALRRGAEIEHFLERVRDGDVATIRWLSAGRAGERYILRLHHVLDVGTSDFRDISAFPPLDADEYAGEGRVVADVGSGEDLLDEACARFGAAGDHWVNQSLAADEYVDALGNEL